ncbi:hypothetical protein WLW87_25345, partial [Bordetella bronchiseptica]
TSGPYTDPQASIDIRRGLPALRRAWIARAAHRGRRTARADPCAHAAGAARRTCGGGAGR